MILSLADLVKTLKNQYFDGEDQPLVMFVTPAIQMATYVSLQAKICRIDVNMFGGNEVDSNDKYFSIY